MGWISLHGGEIFSALKRYSWPGEASVSVSWIFISKSKLGSAKRLNNEAVPKITIFLFHSGENKEAERLSANLQKCFKGIEPGSMRFVFDEQQQQANSSSKMKQLIASNPEHTKLIRPFIGGDEILSDPMLRHQKHIIDFGEMSFSEAALWPDLLALIKANESTADWPNWWWFRRRHPHLRTELSSRHRYIARPYVSTFSLFVFLPSTTLLSSPHCAFAFDAYYAFCVLQSRVHDIFSKFFGLSTGTEIT